MSFSVVLEIKNWFKSQHIVLSSDWIQACTEFVKEERRGQNLSTQQLKNCIYDQWLVADLEELGVSTLPRELASTQKVTLNGTFALQVNGMRDISKPAYTQLKQLEGTTNDNMEVSATPLAPVPEWVAKPTRMLLLNLTDGYTHIQGMEYKPITFLSPNLPPGVKVLVKGPVDCRFGVVLLTAENFQILGGEVESHIGKFSREAVLREVLQLPNAENAVVLNDEDQNRDVNAAPVNHAIHTTTNFPSNNNPSISHSLTSTDSNNLVSRNLQAGNTRTNYNQTVNSNRSKPSSFNNITNYMTNRVGSRDIRSNIDSDNANQNMSLGDLDDFENDDDFVQNLDFDRIDEIERTNSQECIPEDDVFEDWHDDEDMMHDLMAFQESKPEIELPYQAFETNVQKMTISEKYLNAKTDDPFTYLSSLRKEPITETVLTIKAFIITVLSKLSCTPNEGWQLTVKINDGTASIDAEIHDKVLEEFIGISATLVLETQEQASENAEALLKIKQAVSACKLKLQNLNCLMDIRFSPDAAPCIIKCTNIEKLHIKQLMERVKNKKLSSPELIVLSQ